MKICNICGTKNNEKNDFCIECGAELEKIIKKAKKTINKNNKSVSDTKTILKDIDKKFAKKKSKHKVLKILIGILMFYFVMCLIAFIYRKNKNYESYSQIKPTITNQIKNQTENYFKNQTEEQSKKQIENQVNNQVKSIANNEEVNNTSVEGTYIGENKSCLIMKADKTAKYYFYNVKKIVNCTWDFNIEKSKIIIKWNNQDLFIDIPIVDKYFLIYGGGIYWDDEKYEKISNNVTDLSIAKMNDMFFNPNEYYISILKSNIKMKADDYSASINSNNFHGVNFNTPTTWVKKIFDETTEGYIADEDNVMVVNFIESSSEAPEFINEKQKLIKIANAIVEAINSDGYINRVINEDSFKISSINTIKNCVFSFDASAEKDNHIYLNDCKVIVINDGIISFIYMRNKNSKINREDDSKKIFNSIQFDENIIKKY